MKRELLVAAGAITIVTAGLAGCSKSDDSSKEDTSTTSTSATATSSAASSTTSATAAPGTGSSDAGTAIVTVDGNPLSMGGQVVCETSPEGKFSIQIGEPITGVIVGLEKDGSVVHGVGLGEVNGVVLSFTEGVPGNTATATKTDNNYKVSGTATGQDSSGKEVSKPFEVDATCP